jgi:formylglycine-generating enzyme required for sulfatase activity
MAKGQSAFGHGQLAQQLAIRLRQHFSDEKADASLVIGIFGEWGSGKSNLLQLVHDQFGELPQREEKKEGEKKAPPVIVVPFNPWRYEKEEHLLVPLLKTMQRELLGYAEEHQSRLEGLGWSKESPKRIARFFGVSALAFAKALKVSGEIPGVGSAEFSFSDFIEIGAEAFKDKPVPPELLDTLESYYFEFEQKLRDITSGASGEKPIHLLFLIDDLDRCLPEKAVEMLESIKLFLDVEGCAFVLAVDDEVVERGIIHRYRDYIFQGGNGGSANRPLPQMPITGTEYLEKIIQLPFRLPLPAKDEIRAFLRDIPAYSELFGKAAVDQTHRSIGGSSDEHALNAGSEAEELLRLFVEHIPPVPRKQLRAAELLLLQLNIAKARGCAQRIKRVPLAKLIIIQLFAPDLYRFGRRRHAGFMRNLQDWEKTNSDWERNVKSFEKSLEAKINKLQGDQKTGELRLLDRLYKPLIEALENAAHNRSGFDPFRLIREMPFSNEDLQNLHLYFSFVEESMMLDIQAPSGPTEASIMVVRPQAKLANATEFLDLLFSASSANWQSAVQMPEVVGRELDEATFSVVLERLDKKEFKRLLTDWNWLSNLLPLLSSEHFELIKAKIDFASLLSMDRWEESAALLVAMRVEQRQAFAQAVSALQTALLAKAQDEQQPISIRARAGRLLGDSDWLPDDLDTMLPIKAGPFLCGDEKKEARIDKDYWIGKYPVTNAQYRRFVEAGGYKTETFWSQEGWAWREKDENQLPRYWEDRKWANPLSPVVGVSYYEAEAYCRWFQSQMRANPAVFGSPAHQAGALICRLPSNDEWERAASGQDGREYPWLGEFSTAKANSAASWQSADNEERGTTAVNAFPQGESPAGLFDCAGNVWEWTSSQTDGKLRFIRGGAWLNLADFLRCAIRNRFHPGNRNADIGFRLVLSV